MNTEVSDLIAGQKIITMRRIGEAFDWLYRQDLHDVKGFHLFVEDRFVDKPKISVNLRFDTKEQAMRWAHHHLENVFSPEVQFYSSVMSYYAQTFPDFTAYCHFPIEQKAREAV